MNFITFLQHLMFDPEHSSNSETQDGDDEDTIIIVRDTTGKDDDDTGDAEEVE